MKLLHSKRGLAAVAAVVVAGLMLAGCTPSGGAPSSAGSGSPVRGGTLTVGSGNDAVPGFVLAGNLSNASWQRSVFQTLTSLDAKGVPQPVLAKSWKVAANGLSIDVKLRDDVTFSTGRKMTADDVKASFLDTLNPAFGSQLAFIAKQFTAITVQSPTELTIDFAAPLPNIFDFFELTSIIDPTTVSGLANGSKVIGTGPYTWQSWTPGSSLTLVRNANYWGPKPYLDKITVVTISDPTALVNAVRSGRVQYAIGMAGIDVAGFQKNPQYTVVPATGSLYPLGVDVTAAPFDKVAVRQAVQYAIDRKRIVSQVFGGLAQPTTQFWSPSTPGYDSALNNAYAYNPAKAKKMIADAGATGASFTINVIGFGPNISAAQIVQNNLKAVGLNPTVNVLAPLTFIGQQAAGKLGPMFMPLHGLGYGPATLVNLIPSLRPGNPSHEATPEYTALRTSLTHAQGNAVAPATKAISQYITQQAFNVPLVYATGSVVTIPALRQAKASVLGYANFSSAYLSK
jgi:peptide/nickel transport system substrate-binding protein